MKKGLVCPSEGRDFPLLLDLALQREVVENETKSSGDASIIGQWMASKLSDFEELSVISLLPQGEDVAVEAPNLRSLSYNSLRTVLAFANIRQVLDIERGSRVALCAQNGSHLGVALLAIMQDGCCCCPMEPSATEEELVRDLRQLRCSGVVVDDASGAARRAAGVLGVACGLLVAKPGVAGSLSFQLQRSSREGDLLSVEEMPQLYPSVQLEKRSGQPCLVLMTSGTTGKKKSVPYDLRTLAVSAACIIKSWKLRQHDVCLTMMPLTHVGGIVRNLLAVLFSGGRLFCYPSFDPLAFWPIIEERGVTWYYASPTMHRAILEEGRNRKPKTLLLRMVCNAAGGLPPSLAQELRERFQCPVLPSYGMTECMPISSPPVDFMELAPKTSGCPCGPEVAIMTDDGHILPRGDIGNIAVRGPPVMDGYEDAESNEDCWHEGWFLTGDLGYLSENGWLQVTGRTKEVIKRGGETIAPLEIEETILRHLRLEVKELAVFAIKDVEMGENVALAIVRQPDRPMIGLPRLHSILREILQHKLWPQALVYCDLGDRGLPKTSTGKVQRAKLMKVCGDVAISQSTAWRDRVFHVTSCDVSGLKLVHPSGTNVSHVEQVLLPFFSKTLFQKQNDGKLNVLYALGNHSREHIQDIVQKLDDFDKPDAIVQMSTSDFPQVLPSPKVTDFLLQQSVDPPSTEEEKAVSQVWASIFSCDATLISRDTNFFEAGGSSLQAGRVASELRMHFRSNLPIHIIFTNPCLKDLAAAIKEHRATEKQSAKVSSLSSRSLWDHDKSHIASPLLMEQKLTAYTRREEMGPSSSNPLVLSVQFLAPIICSAAHKAFVFAGFGLGLRFVTIYMTDTEAEVIPFWTYFIGLLMGWSVSHILLPIAGIILKWLILGRLKPGQYRLWGLMYVRWWVVKQIFDIWGEGIFGSFQLLRKLHLRLLGASVAWSANISSMSSQVLSTADLLDIQAEVTLDHARLKCAALDGEGGHIVFAPIILERGVFVGLKTIVAPGSRLPPQTTLGILTSSHEMQDADDQWRRFNTSSYPPPHPLLRFFLGYPLKAFCSLVTMLPWLYFLQYVTAGKFWGTQQEGWVFVVVERLAQPRRIALWILAFSIMRSGLTMVIYVPLVILLKWLVIGRFRPGPWTQWSAFQYWFMNLLIGKNKLDKFAALIGPHYNLMTLYYRLMGASVGKHIFWPGKPFDIIEYDLLEVGNDVTFGSRTTILCTDANGFQKVRILSGAMIADNCCILPGTVVGQNAVLGTGSLGNGIYDRDSVCLGNQAGSAVVIRGSVSPLEETIEDVASDTSTADSATKTSRLEHDDAHAVSQRPFGQVFYGSSRAAPYTVLGWRSILLINIAVRVIWAPVASADRWLVLYLAGQMLPELRWYHKSDLQLFLIMLGLVILVQIFKRPFKVLVDVGLKWILIGRRQVGSYTWDKSSYCQRWKLYTSIRGVLKPDVLQFGGSWWIVLYYRLMGANIGRNVCLYPWGASPMMTEPDLVTIGDGGCIEAAHLVAHTNVKGEFTLQEVRVGPFCTLRDQSRLLSGAEMLEGATLLEHSLVMPGEVMPAGSTWQGWPNRWQNNDRQFL